VLLVSYELSSQEVKDLKAKLGIRTIMLIVSILLALVFLICTIKFCCTPKPEPKVIIRESHRAETKSAVKMLSTVVEPVFTQPILI